VYRKGNKFGGRPYIYSGGKETRPAIGCNNPRRLRLSVPSLLQVNKRADVAAPHASEERVCAVEERSQHLGAACQRLEPNNVSATGVTGQRATRRRRVKLGWRGSAAGSGLEVRERPRQLGSFFSFLPFLVFRILFYFQF
jgi:hypothetical protein